MLGLGLLVRKSFQQPFPMEQPFLSSQDHDEQETITMKEIMMSL